MDDKEVVDETYLEETLEESEGEVTENSLLGCENRCKVCLKSFTRRSSLTCHIKDIHEQSGNYACGFCDKKFYKESTKMVHERKHTGIKPYACEKCGKSYGRRSSLDKHCELDHKMSNEEISIQQADDNEMVEVGILQQKDKQTN